MGRRGEFVRNFFEENPVPVFVLAVLILSSCGLIVGLPLPVENGSRTFQISSVSDKAGLQLCENKQTERLDSDGTRIAIIMKRCFLLTTDGPDFQMLRIESEIKKD